MYLGHLIEINFLYSFMYSIYYIIARYLIVHFFPRWIFFLSFHAQIIGYYQSITRQWKYILKFDRETCHNAWRGLRMTPLFGCICPNSQHKKRCDRVYNSIYNNSCIGKLVGYREFLSSVACYGCALSEKLALLLPVGVLLFYVLSYHVLRLLV